MYKPVEVDEDEKIVLDAKPVDKKYEADVRQKQLEILLAKKDEINKHLVKARSDQEKALQRALIIANRKRIEELEHEHMDEDRFWNYMNDENEFQYGRNVLMDKTLDHMVKCPYSKLELTTMPGLVFEELKILDPRELSDDGYQKRYLKTKIVVESMRDDLMKFDVEEEFMDDADGDDAYISLEVSKIAAEYPFNITDEKFMDLVKTPEHFICRVYVLRCQNLAASSSKLNVKDRLAGFSNQCTATPYLVLKIGDGKSGERGRVKMINERDKAQPHTLNPEFYQVYEFDIQFPEDWRLSIEVHDASGYITDGVIGYTQIDLEDRFYGDPNLTLRRSLEIYRRMYTKELNELERSRKKDEASVKRKAFLKNKQREVASHITFLDKRDRPKIPAEFRELVTEDKGQSQGIIEMWTEIFPAKDSKLFPLHTIKPPSKEEYEIRLIIWNTRDVKLVNGESVDIFVKVIFDPQGWSSDTIEKQTDIHYNSKDGRGEFNWRMKFQIELPCEFPRIKIQVYGHGTITNEIIGENTINLQKALANLQKEGEIDIPNTWINLQNPEDENEDCGSLKFSMTIVSKMVADGQPVGEAWDEPNENPRLIPPTAGRGFGDKFAAYAIDFSKWKLPSWLFFRNFALIGSVLGVLGLVVTMLAMRM